jgi:hypothetical protein
MIEQDSQVQIVSYMLFFTQKYEKNTFLFEFFLYICRKSIPERLLNKILVAQGDSA